MPFTLANLKHSAGARTSSKRVGRGAGSGHGTTAGRGTKGQRARSGGRRGLAAIGLKRIMSRIPKHRGFKSIHPKAAVVNVEVLQERFDAGAIITPAAILEKRLVRDTRGPVKILGQGTLTKAFTIKGCDVSASAKEKIVKAGGKIE